MIQTLNHDIFYAHSSSVEPVTWINHVCVRHYNYIDHLLTFVYFDIGSSTMPSFLSPCSVISYFSICR